MDKRPERILREGRLSPRCHRIPQTCPARAINRTPSGRSHYGAAFRHQRSAAGPLRDRGERRHSFLILSITGEELVVFISAATATRRLVAQHSHKLGPVITVAVITASPKRQVQLLNRSPQLWSGFHGDLVEDSQEFISGLGKVLALRRGSASRPVVVPYT